MLHKKKKPVSSKKATPFKINPDQKDPIQNPAFHRRILNFLNEAIMPEDLMYEKITAVHAEGGGHGHEGNPMHEDNPDVMKMKRKMIMNREMAKNILDFREKGFPLGFRNIKEILEKRIFDITRFRDLFHLLSDTLYGRWDTFPQSIPRRGPGSYDGVVHADRKSTRLNSSHLRLSRMPSSA